MHNEGSDNETSPNGKKTSERDSESANKNIINPVNNYG